MSQYFFQPKSLGANARVKLDLFNYATKTDFKNAPEVRVSDFAEKTDLANLKFVVHKLDIDELKSVI